MSKYGYLLVMSVKEILLVPGFLFLPFWVMVLKIFFNFSNLFTIENVSFAF